MPDIPQAELDDLRAKAKDGEKFKPLYEALLPKYNEAQAGLTKIPTLEQEITTLKAGEVNRTFEAVGIKDPKIRGIFERDYADLQPEAGKEKPTLGDWLTGMQQAAPDKRPAHLAPFLPAANNGAGNGAGAGTQRTQAGLPDAGKGVKTVSNAGKFTPEQIKNMSPADYRANRDAILADADITAPALPASKQ